MPTSDASGRAWGPAGDRSALPPRSPADQPLPTLAGHWVLMTAFPAVIWPRLANFGFALSQLAGNVEASAFGIAFRATMSANRAGWA